MQKIPNKNKKYKSDPESLIRDILLLLIFICAIILGLELAIPLELNNNPDMYIASRDLTNSGASYSELGETRTESVDFFYRSGLFKPVKTVDRPMADKNIQNIYSKLDLQVITQLDGQPVAYVKIEGQGFERCFVNDNIKDLFTVISIGENSIKIKILDHEMTLYL